MAAVHCAAVVSDANELEGVVAGQLKLVLVQVVEDVSK